MVGAFGEVQVMDWGFAFELDGTAYAVPFPAFAGGAVFRAGQRDVFLYRPQDAEPFQSSVAFVGPAKSFKRTRRGWVHRPTKTLFVPADGAFDGAGDEVAQLAGFDTFWFNWSMSRPETELLGGD